jgi:hypothetical protein
VLEGWGLVSAEHTALLVRPTPRRPSCPRPPAAASLPRAPSGSHETTAAVLTWALFSVAQAPEVEAKLLAEIDAAIGDRTPSERARGRGGAGGGVGRGPWCSGACGAAPPLAAARVSVKWPAPGARAPRPRLTAPPAPRPPPAIDDLKALPYLRATLAESLRMYPQPPLLIRRALAPDTLPSGLGGDPNVRRAGGERTCGGRDGPRCPTSTLRPPPY